MMTEGKETESVLVHLRDLKKQSERRYMHTESGFLNEEELAAARREFPESALVRYEGGYPEARKKKVIFRKDEEDDLCDVVCISAETDLRFRTIEHRDILGALMSLQIDRRSFGDFWREERHIHRRRWHASCVTTFCGSQIRMSAFHRLRNILPRCLRQRR